MAEIKFKTYKTRREISSHKELVTAIISFKEVYRCIFPNASNPRIEIRAFSWETGESFFFDIDTRFKRETSAGIERDYNRIIAKNDIISNFDNISGVVFFTTGTYYKYREYTIYNNPDIPWDNHNFIMVEW